MSRFRSSLIVVIVSLFVLTGYGIDLFGDCCSHQAAAQVEHGKAAPDKQSPADSDGCQCVCHQVMTPVLTDPVRVAAVSLVERDFVVSPNEIPPDAVPVGIEYPPQLA